MLSDDEVSEGRLLSDCNYFDLFRPETRMHWVRLMRICHHWYNIGKSSPWLWRRISITRNLESLEFRLERTVGCTIDVFFSTDHRDNDSAMSLLIPFAPHIRCLETPEDFRFDALPSIKPIFQVALPALEYVRVLPCPYVRGLGHSQWHGASDQSPDWFDLGLSGALHPRLRRLELHRIVIPPPPAFFKTLRVLNIDLKDLRTTSNGRPPLSPEDIVNILAHTPHLEALEVCGHEFLWCHESDPTLSVALEPGVVTQHGLPCLRKVVLTCPYLFAASILQVIDAPALSVFHVEVSTKAPIEADMGSLIFPPSLRFVVQQYTELLVTKTTCSGFKICSAEHKPDRDTYERNRLHLQITDITYSDRMDPLEVALTTLSDTFGIASQMQSLSFIDFRYSPSRTMWGPIHTTFPALRSVSLQICSPLVIVKFLCAFLALSKEDAWLTLRDLNISTGSQWLPNSWGVHAIADLILAAARTRAERGVPLESVDLEHDIVASTPITPHRWTLWGVHLACKRFDFRIYQYHGRHNIPRRLGQFFTPAERRRLLDGSWNTSGSGASPDGAADATAQTADVDDLEDGVEDDGIQVVSTAPGFTVALMRAPRLMGSRRLRFKWQF